MFRFELKAIQVSQITAVTPKKTTPVVQSLKERITSKKCVLNIFENAENISKNETTKSYTPGLEISSIS